MIYIYRGDAIGSELNLRIRLPDSLSCSCWEAMHLALVRVAPNNYYTPIVYYTRTRVIRHIR